MPHLYDNATFGFSAVSTSAPYVIGNPFTVDTDITLSQIGFYRDDTGANTKPTHLAVYRTSDGTMASPDVAPTAPAGTGWQWTDLAAALVLPPGTYIVVGYWPTGNVWYRNTSAGRPTAPTGISWPSYRRSDESSSWPTYPDAEQDNFCQNGVDITFVVGSFPPPPPDTDQISYAELRDEQERWLSANAGVNTHQLDLPWQTKVVADAIKATTDRLNGISNGAITWLNTRSTDAVDFLNSVNAGMVAALNALGSRITGSTSEGGSAFFSSNGQTTAQNTADTLALLQLLVAVERNALVDFPGDPWVHTDTIAFDGDLAWAAPADLYVVTFTDLGSASVNAVSAGVDICYRLAWWTPLIGAFGQQRRFIDFPSAHLWMDGQRMPGVLLRAEAGGSGTVDAWTYS